MDTKEALLNTAEVAVRRRGYNGFSYADLAKNVGIRKASIHYHFPKKADLAMAVMARYTDNIMSALHEISEKQEKASDRLIDVIDIYRTALGNCDMLCLCVAFSSGPDGLDQEILDEIYKFQIGVQSWLETLFELGAKDGSIEKVVKPGADAAACLAQLQGAQLMARAVGDLNKFEEAVSTLMARI